MTRHRLVLRRLSAIAGATLAGIAATLAFASPAAAHHPIVEGQAVCDTAAGDWVVTWKVGNSETDLTGKIIEMTLTPAGTTVTNIAVGATLPKKGDGVLTGVQRVSADKTQAKLAVTARWIRNGDTITEDASATVSFKEACVKQTAPEPTASFSTGCDGVVTVTLKNGADATAPAEFTVAGKDGWVARKTVEPGKTDDSIKVPAANSQEITVTEGADNTPVAKSGRAVPANCGGLPVTGVQAGAIATGALALLGAGAGLFVVARRRRIRFTA